MRGRGKASLRDLAGDATLRAELLNTLALFGDSITVSMAFWAPLTPGSMEAPEEWKPALERVWKYQREECWRRWRGPEFGNEGRMTIRWAHENVDAWLEKLNPEAAVMMFGTNDLGELEHEEYEAKTRDVIRRCLENGTVLMLTTIPPRSGMQEKASGFAEIARRVARDLRVPLIDYHAEILKRRPEDWDGSAPQFREAVEAGGSEYEAPAPLSADGVHPSNPREYQDYSEKSLNNNGFALRNYMTLLRYAEVIEQVLEPAGAEASDAGESPDH
ncbi:MAG TPA: SGNH/GDSL hydrolase family protein [Verrucomicrobiales bacterium]|nr:SGNH/GDSL hydrolase family protein [Verrucomicrobiales bacterium]